MEANYDRTWEYRFYDESGLITAGDYPPGIDGLDSDEQAWRAADLFKRENGIIVSRIERRKANDTWENVPVL
ncbi:hypothetical protein [Streptomyces sp. NBC_01190]|uniref:hypothetical protein n=1 Tax=Streptomyces sp. NBC_01190 TaxID=2903767 RepID=UPI00386CDD7D|nr:hypothetical protein OG519_07350 [Streptomyces sp. NBC_01190]